MANEYQAGHSYPITALSREGRTVIPTVEALGLADLQISRVQPQGVIGVAHL